MSYFENKLINYETSLSTIVDKLMQKDKGIKMYSEDDNKVLETSLVKEDADKIFGDYLDIKDTVKVKILFRDAKDNKEVENGKHDHDHEDHGSTTGCTCCSCIFR